MPDDEPTFNHRSNAYITRLSMTLWVLAAVTYLVVN